MADVCQVFEYTCVATALGNYFKNYYNIAADYDSENMFC